VTTTGRALLIVGVGLAGLAGCEGGGPLTSRQTMMGSLKSSVSQLEFQNDELQRQVATLKSENRRFEDRLVQERSENELLATQLDNARGQLGLDTSDTRTGARARLGNEDESEESTPKARPSRSRRKPPAASIPGRIEPARTAPDDDEVGSVDLPPARSRLASRRSLDDRWLPVARGTGSGPAAVK
jgi:hypothetical protein